MKTGGFRYALEKLHKGRWITIASADDLPLLQKMLGDNTKPARTSWRIVDRTTDKVLHYHAYLGPVDRDAERHAKDP